MLGAGERAAGRRTLSMRRRDCLIFLELARLRGKFAVQLRN